MNMDKELERALEHDAACADTRQQANGGAQSARPLLRAEAARAVPVESTRCLNEDLGDSLDYDRSVHSNPDAGAWAAFFCGRMKKLGQPCPDESTMLGWFANAMMARHDYDLSAGPKILGSAELARVCQDLSVKLMERAASVLETAWDERAGTQQMALEQIRSLIASAEQTDRLADKAALRTP